MRVKTDKLQVTFIPRIRDNIGKMLFWLPPQYTEFSIEQILKEVASPAPIPSLEDTKARLVLPARWVLKRRPRSKAPRVFTVKGKTLSILDSLTLLSVIGNDTSFYKGLSSSLKVWSLAAKFALELVTRGQIVPTLEMGSENTLKALWRVSLWINSDRGRFLKLSQAMPLSAHALLYKEENKKKKSSPAIYSSKAVLQQFLDEAADSLVRYEASRERREQGFFAGFLEDSWDNRFIRSLIGPDSTFHIKGFSERYIPQVLDRWLRPVITTHQYEDYRLCFRLEMPSGEEVNDNQWRISYLLQAGDDPSLLVPAEKVWRASGKELRFLSRTFKDPQERLLMGLAEASSIFPSLAESLKKARPSYARIDIGEAWNFIREAAVILQQSGYGVLLPEELTQAGQRRIRLRMRVGSGSSDKGRVAGTERFDLPSLVDYRWEVALGKETLSASEFRQIARLKRPLVRWRGHWVVVDSSEIAKIEKLLKRDAAGKLRLQEALTAALLGKREQDDLEMSTEVVATGNMRALVNALKADGGLRPIKTPSAFQGRLRPYQKRGLTWLNSMTNIGFGTCLADDMGLGKTIQVIAWLLHRKELLPDDPHPILIVCPTSVLGNWQREIERFAPDLPVLRHHGLNRARSRKSLERNFSPHMAVLTTYALTRRDREMLAQIEWAAVILDEAQNIKNPFSQQARAVRQLKTQSKVALTGTPVENRLSELWSIFEFLNPGLLGPLKRFKHKFALPIERYKDLEATGKLKRITGPFLLRRLKTDKSIINDLPEKNEMRVFCTLTQEQATLYQAAMDEIMERIEKEEGMARRGLILSLITSLKQICNHPSLYLRESGSLPGRSGKLERLEEMCEEVVEEGEHALIFTQFREMGHLLARYLEDKIGIQVPFLHGGVPIKKREEMIHSFQEDEDASPVFLLSLKAGGTGLNLTRASFVFHFDRWWNPAVEDQATDRAFRIGQRKNVQVYKMVCLGTLEEKIDKMLEEKSELAQMVVGAGEGWVTEMSNEKLREILTLSHEATVDS